MTPRGYDAVPGMPPRLFCGAARLGATVWLKMLSSIEAQPEEAMTPGLGAGAGCRGERRGDEGTGRYN